MMKWFRKHNKQLLAVFASALLIVWLGGQAFENMFRTDPMKATVGTAFGHSLKGRDYAALKSRLDLLESMGVAWQVPWRNPWVMEQLMPPNQRLPQDPIMMAGARPLTGSHGLTQWWLLDQEARRMGVTISESQVKQFFKDSNVSADRLTKIRDSMNVSTDDLFGAVAEYLRVSYAARLASAAVQISEPEVKDLFVQTNDQVTVRYALLPAGAFEAKNAAASQPVSEAEMQDLFSKYRDNLPGAGKYGFGYKIPDRVSVQYVGASVDDITRTLPPVSDDRARKYFEANKERFEPRRPPTTQPTTQPTVTFEQVKDQVVEQMRQNDAAALLRQVMEEVRASAFSEFTGSKGELEAGKTPESLKGILEQRRNEFSTSKKLPLVYRQTGLISQEEAAKEPGINSAHVLGAQGQPVEFATYAFLLEKPGQTADKAQEEALTKLKLWQPVAVRDQAGDRLRGMYVFRVISQETSHSPATITDVREQVERDAKTMSAYRKAEAAAQKLEAAAQKEGLRAAFATEFPTLATRPVTTRPTATPPATPEVEMFEQDNITRARAVPAYFALFNDSLTFPTRLLGVQEAAPLLKAAFEMTSASSSQPASNRVSLVELPEQKAFVIVEVVSHKPANEPDFAKAKANLVSQLQMQKLRNFYAAWYNPEMIEKRTGWQGKGSQWE